MGKVRDALALLANQKELDQDQIYECFQEIIEFKECTASQIGAFLMALPKPAALSPELLSRASDALLSFAVKLEMPNSDLGVLDIVGTGGDSAGVDTFNVSTASGFIIAASKKILVAKHGNRSSSGKCGSADFIEALGIPLELPPTSLSKNILEKAYFSFFFAQKCHPAMKSVGVVRKELGVRTIFNFMGPLSNPAVPSYMLVGVGVPALGPTFAEILRRRKGFRRAMIVHSFDGMDEISPAEKTRVWLVDVAAEKQITEMVISPEDFGLQAHSLDLISGGKPEYNAALWNRIIENPSALKDPKDLAILDFLLINAGASFFIASIVSDLKKGADLARDLLFSGQVKTTFEKYLELTQQEVKNQ